MKLCHALIRLEVLTKVQWYPLRRKGPRVHFLELPQAAQKVVEVWSRDPAPFVDPVPTLNRCNANGSGMCARARY